MKILQFTIPVPDNKTIITFEQQLPYFYPHLHRHHEVQLTWIIRGEGTLVADNSMHSFHNNEIYWVGANQSHVFKSDPICFEERDDTRTHAIDIFFNLNNQLSPFFAIPEVRQLSNFVSRHQTGFKVPPDKTAIVAKHITAVSQSTGVEQFIHFIELLNVLAALPNLIPLSNRNANLHYSETEGIRIATIYNYIMQHYREQITLGDMAALVYMTPQAFCRYFKKHTRHTPMSLVNHLRINEACKKLVENNYDSISTIAYNTGFNSVTNFNRVFKSITQKSPKEYQESYFKHMLTDAV